MKRRDIDIFGILLGVVIGLIIGFLVSSSFELPGKSHENEDKTIADAGNIYLLQVDKFDDPDKASSLIKEIKTDNLNAIAVNVGLNYYVYAAIAKTEEALLLKKSEFETKGYEVLIKREYILDKSNAVIEDEKLFKFYGDMLTSLMTNLEGKHFEIDENHFEKPVNLELLTLVISLQNIKNEKLLNEIRLSVYEIIIESLV